MMKSFEKLNEGNFLIYAMKAYSNPNCMDISDFNDDLKRIKYIKRLLNRYKGSPTKNIEDLKERLILNHIVIFYNMFGLEAATRMLFFKLGAELDSPLKTFLTYLGYMPEWVRGVRPMDIINSDIPIDWPIANILRKL